MKKKYLSQRIRHSLRHMRLSDRCLCLFLLFLLLQSAWHIFLPPDLTKEFDAMDAMIRSSAATIFGYFISNAFGSMPEKSETEIPLESREKIPAESLAAETPLPSGINCRIWQQILIVAGVGFFLTDHPHLCTDVYFSIPRCHSFPFPIPEFSSVQYRIFGWTCKI